MVIYHGIYIYSVVVMNMFLKISLLSISSHQITLSISIFLSCLFSSLIHSSLRNPTRMNETKRFGIYICNVVVRHIFFLLSNYDQSPHTKAHSLYLYLSLSFFVTRQCETNPWYTKWNVLVSRSTALRNHMRIVFEKMSSWTPLTMYLGMQTTFETKYIKSKYFRTFIMRI